MQTDFFDWGASGLNYTKPQFDRMSPALVSLYNYLEERWGGKHLGLDDYERPIRGGKKPSTHAYGAALDYRFDRHPDVQAREWPGRATLDAEIIPFIINNSLELGVDAIIDDRRSWRPPAYRDRIGQSHDDGWRTVRTRYYGWIHIEVLPGAFEDGRTVEEKLGGVPGPAPKPPAVSHPWKRFVDESPKPVLRVGSKGEYVRHIQDVMKVYGQDVAVDGHFGPQTDSRVKDVQRFWGLAVDGVVGNKQTWPVYDYLASLKIAEG